MRTFRRLAAVVCLAGPALGAYGVFIEPGRLMVHSVAIETAKWPGSHPPLRIAFLTDLHLGAPHIGLARIREIVQLTNALKPDPVGVLSQIAGSDPIVVLAHDPAIFPTVPKRAAAILAGHMHGGQVYLPFLGVLIAPGHAPNRHAFGLIREDGRTMYAGAGTSIIPVRINMPPEIAIVTVRGNSSKQTQRR